jgi:tungstate transport system substrate-binding protein
MKTILALLLLIATTALPTTAIAAETVILASTTSLDNSGLLARILPLFTARTGIEVRVLAQGTGQALATAARGDADLVLVHDPEAEDAFMAAGNGITRVEIAWNDFIFVGPKSDPAGIANTSDAVAALRKIAEARAPFVSRGDKSGTDALEKRLWRDTGINPAGAPWYKDIGGGMGAALNVAAATDATTLTDRGTWLSFANRRDLVELVHGDPRLINRYRVIELAPGRHKSGAIAAAHSLAQWFAGPEAQTAIGAFTVGGKALFNPGVKDIR